MPALSRDVLSRPPHGRPPEVLFRSRVQAGEQAHAATEVAEQPGEPGLLQRARSGCAGPTVAEGSSGLREESARQMVAHVEDMQADFPGAMVVIGGDFNLLLNQADMAHERTVEILKDAGFTWGWEGVAMADRVTWPSDGRYPDACFDMFMFRGVEGRCSVLRKYEGLSDHLPVVLPMD
jgi:hypothetical protein